MSSSVKFNMFFLVKWSHFTIEYDPVCALAALAAHTANPSLCTMRLESVLWMLVVGR